MTAIHFASQKGHTEVVRSLLVAGAYVNARNRKGMIPLHFAVQGGHADLVRLLVRKGANLDSENKAKKKPIDLIRDQSLRSVIKEAEIERNNRRAKSKEKPQQQLAIAREEKNKATSENVAHVSENAVTESQRPNDPHSISAAEKPWELGDALDQDPTGVSGDLHESEEDANVVIGPKRKKAKVALTHLFSENDDDEVD